jgi:hypothetical protein
MGRVYASMGILALLRCNLDAPINGWKNQNVESAVRVRQRGPRHVVNSSLPAARWLRHYQWAENKTKAKNGAPCLSMWAAAFMRDEAALT